MPLLVPLDALEAPEVCGLEMSCRIDELQGSLNTLPLWELSWLRKLTSSKHCPRRKKSLRDFFNYLVTCNNVSPMAELFTNLCNGITLW